MGRREGPHFTTGPISTPRAPPKLSKTHTDTTDRPAWFYQGPGHKLDFTSLQNKKNMLEATGTAKFQVWPFAFKPNPFHMRCLSFQEALEQPHRQGHICFLFLAPILGVLANRLSPAVAQTLGSTLLPSALSWLPVPWNTRESCSLKVIEALHSPLVATSQRFW